MNEIPTWWLILSGLFFALHSVLLLSMVIAIFMIVRKMGPLVQKVDQIAQKVDGLVKDTGEKVTRITSNIAGVTDNAKRVAGAVSENVGRWAPYAAGAMAIMKLGQTAREMKKGPAEKAADQAKNGVKTGVKAAKRKGSGLLQLAVRLLDRQK